MVTQDHMQSFKIVAYFLLGYFWLVELGGVLVEIKGFLDCQDIEEFNSNSNEDDEILEQQLSDEEDDVRIEEISSEEEEQQTQDRRNRFSSRAKKDRRKDSRTFTNLKKRAKAEAQNYEIRVKSEKKNYITYEVKNLRNKEIYQVTFDEKDVT